MRKWCLAAAAAVVVAGCGSGTAHTTAPPGTDLRQVSVTTAELNGLAAADTAFGRQLLQRLQETDSGNVAVSPASIATALQMAYVGARGRTATEMAAVLRVEGLQPAQVAAAASRLLTDLAPLAHDRASLLTLVDAVWVQSGFSLTPGYEAMMATGFGAALHRLDLGGDPEASRQKINDAVAEATRQKIRGLIRPLQINPMTRLVLTNAVYLKAQWQRPFSPTGTSDREFRRDDGSAVRTPTMSMDAQVAYAHGPGYQAVRLPYTGGRLAMTIVVPNGRSAGYPAHMGPFAPAFVDVWLPKFRFTWAHELTGALQAMGMHAAFDGADFSGISTAEALHVSFVQHQAFIDVNETGTEAAAATAIGGDVSGAIAPPRIAVHADHPFYFAITDTQTGLVLFLGHIADPTAG